MDFRPNQWHGLFEDQFELYNYQDCFGLESSLVSIGKEFNDQNKTHLHAADSNSVSLFSVHQSILLLMFSFTLTAIRRSGWLFTLQSMTLFAKLPRPSIPISSKLFFSMVICCSRYSIFATSVISGNLQMHQLNAWIDQQLLLLLIG